MYLKKWSLIEVSRKRDFTERLQGERSEPYNLLNLWSSPTVELQTQNKAKDVFLERSDEKLQMRVKLADVPWKLNIVIIDAIMRRQQ